MASHTGIRRVIIVVLDGPRPDAIDAFGLTNMARVMVTGASFLADLPTIFKGIGARVGRLHDAGRAGGSRRWRRRSKNHESHHPLDTTIPLVFAGPGIIAATLVGANLLDVPATTLYALGIPVPPTYEGHPHTDIFAAALDTAVA